MASCGDRDRPVVPLVCYRQPLVTACLAAVVLLVYRRFLGELLAAITGDGLLTGAMFLGVAAFLLLRYWQAFGGVAQRPALGTGACLIFAGILFAYFARIGGVLVLEAVSFVLVLVGLFVFGDGPKYFRIALFPLLLVLVPLGVYNQALGLLSWQLQLSAAMIADVVLNTLGVLTLRKGIYLHLPHITLVVQPLCNGVNHISALGVLGFALGGMKPLANMSILVVASVATGLLLNGLRVATIGLWSMVGDPDVVHGPGGVLYAFTVFPLGTIPLLFLAGRMKNARIRHVPEPMKLPEDRECSRTKIRTFATTVLTLGLIFITLGTPRPVPPKCDLVGFPHSIGEWTDAGEDSVACAFEAPNADVDLRRMYYNGDGDTVTIYVGYFSRQEQDREVVHFRSRALFGESRQYLIERASGQNTTVNYANVRDRSVIFWYMTDRGLVHSPYRAKMSTMMTGILKGRTNGAYVAVSWRSARVDPKEDVLVFVESALPFLLTLF